MLGAHELDSPYGRLVCSEGEEVARTEYLHKVAGPESPQSFCKHVDRLSVHPVKYFIKHKCSYTAQKLNKSTLKLGISAFSVSLGERKVFTHHYLLNDSYVTY